MKGAIANPYVRTSLFRLVLATTLLFGFTGVAFAAYPLIRAKYFDAPTNRETFASQLREQYDAAHFDENTGWRPLKQLTTADGSRISPDNPESSPCLSMYGD